VNYYGEKSGFLDLNTSISRIRDSTSSGFSYRISSFCSDEISRERRELSLKSFYPECSETYKRSKTEQTSIEDFRCCICNLNSLS